MDIELVKISKKFNQNQVIENLNVFFDEGKINCLMGASGSGKTTLINIVMGLEKADAGEIYGMKGNQISAVFQEDRLIEHWDAMQNVKLVCDRELQEAYIEQEFIRVKLFEFKNKPVIKLSGGMRRRVALVRAMLAKSDIVIMDEPFQGLDDTLKRQVIEYVIQKTKGKTVIVVTHDKEEVQLLGAKRIIID